MGRVKLIKKNLLVIIIIALIVVVLVMGVLIGKRFVLHEKYQNDQIKVLQDEISDSQAAIKELNDDIVRLSKMISSLDNSNGFYQKLKNGHYVNILIVGDSIGAGTGASDREHRWTNLLAEWIQSAYGVDLTLTNVSMGGNTSYAGYARTMILEDGIEYDLAIICYGQNDSDEGFSANYEAIIRGLRARYTSCSIISILESSQKTYTEKMGEIEKLADYYTIPVADTIEAFDESGYEYILLAEDGIHPNDIGQNIYFETIRDIIADKVEKNEPLERAALKPINNGVTEYDNYKFIPVDDFSRLDDVTWEIESDQMSGVIGIYRSYNTGDCTLKVYIDDVLFKETVMDWAYEFSQDHFDQLCQEKCTINKTIRLVFTSSEQADGFKGLLITGL